MSPRLVHCVQRAGGDPDRLGRERSQVKEDEMVGHHPENRDRADAVDDRVVERWTRGERVPVASQVEQTKVVPQIRRGTR